MTITGCMLTFYKTTPAVIFWHTMNQGFNALANYTNRNASAEMSDETLAVACVSATAAGVSSALIFNKIIASTPALAGGMMGRFVPLLAVATANGVNIPLMRQSEIKNGIHISTLEGEEVGASGNAATAAIKQVIPSRIAMAAPAMVMTPLIMSRLEKTATLIKNPWLKAPATVLLTGFALSFSTPACCALFPQRASIATADLEPDLREKLSKSHPGVNTFYYNKGL